jgi:sugar lactone lactonase YvrE
MARQLRAEHVATVGAQLGEGPAWDAARGELTFVDIVAGALYRLRPDGRAERVLEIDEPLAAALPAADGTRLLVTRAGFVVADEHDALVPVLDVLASRPDLRFNDAKCDASGRCFAGTLSLEGTSAAGTLYRLDDGPIATPVVSEVGLSNGLGWSPDGGVLYFVDTLSGHIRAFDYDSATGDLGPSRIVVLAEPGTPDGMCVDHSGCLWVAFWGQGEVRRFTPSGVLDAVVELPVPNVTSCAFGGRAGDILYITTAAGGPADDGAPPLAGDLFALRPGVTGPAAVPWSGTQG